MMGSDPDAPYESEGESELSSPCSTPPSSPQHQSPLLRLPHLPILPTPPSSIASYHTAVRKRRSFDLHHRVRPVLLRGKEMPWPSMVFNVAGFLPDWLARHLEKRIVKSKSRLTTDPYLADVILTIVHPAFQPFNRHYHTLPSVVRHETRVVSYTWLARAYFTGLVPEGESRGVFVSGENGVAMRIGVGAMDREKRREVMVLLETYGAVVVPEEESEVCVLEDGHPFLSMSPSEEGWDGIRWRDVAWVEEYFRTGSLDWGTSWEVPEGGEKAGEAVAETTIHRLPDVVDAGEEERKEGGVPEPPGEEEVMGEVVVVEEPRAISNEEKRKPRRHRKDQHPFIDAHRLCLARWLADNAPEERGRTARAVWQKLAEYGARGGKEAAWVREHPRSAWRSHYAKMRRGKGGIDEMVRQVLSGKLPRKNPSLDEDLDGGPKVQGETMGPTPPANFSDLFRLPTPPREVLRMQGENDEPPLVRLDRSIMRSKKKKAGFAGGKNGVVVQVRNGRKKRSFWS